MIIEYHQYRFGCTYSQQNYMAQEEATFFATQIAQTHQQPQPKDPLAHIVPPEIQKSIDSLLEDQNSLKNLLTAFNVHDKQEKGLINIEHVEQILKSRGCPPNNVKQYHQMSLPIFEDSVSFDQFLFIFALAQNESELIEDKYAICRTVDDRLIDFLKLLNNYRKKSEKNGNYKQAKNSKKKVEEIRGRELERRNKYLKILYDQQVTEAESTQRSKFEQFCKKWDQFMNEYELTATELTKKVKEKQVTQIKQYEQSVREQLAPKMHYSKYLLELQLKEKNLVKLQEYEKAGVIQQQIEQTKARELRDKQLADQQTLQLRLKSFRKQQEATINTLLQKIQKDRNDHIKQRQSQTEKLIVRNKSQLSEIDRSYNQNSKRIYEALHNMGLDSEKSIRTPKK